MNFIMFMDESGDHNLLNIDHNFPVFCLVGCVFERHYYRNVVRPRVDAFKMRFWNTMQVVLHSREIRKHQGAFSFLGDQDKRNEFYKALNDLIQELDFVTLAIVIMKQNHLDAYGTRAHHPYHLSLEFIMERYSMMMRRQGRGSTGYILAESRGRREDNLLKGQYQQLCKMGTFYQKDLSNITGLWMRKKDENIVGLQIADLAAYPIAAKVLRPYKEQKAFDVLLDKIDVAPRHRGGGILGYGLKVFPQPNFDHYQLWG